MKLNCVKAPRFIEFVPGIASGIHPRRYIRCWVFNWQLTLYYGKRQSTKEVLR